MQYLNEIEIKYKRKRIKIFSDKIKNSEDGEKAFRKIWRGDDIDLRERCYGLFLNRANEIIGFSEIAIGGITGTVVDARLIFATALKVNATGLILAHNHPSGNLNPSAEDLKITKRIKEIGILHDISLLDHVILTRESYYSFADKGRL